MVVSIYDRENDNVIDLSLVHLVEINARDNLYIQSIDGKFILPSSIYMLNGIYDEYGLNKEIKMYDKETFDKLTKVQSK